MARLQDFQTVTPTDSDNLLVVQATGQGLATVGSTLGAKMDKANPTGTGSLNINRKAETTVGQFSVAVGRDCMASGHYSCASGYETTASGHYSHAESDHTTASGHYSHAESDHTTASGYCSHSEGTRTTASGTCAHAEGTKTIANRRSQHVFGEYNIEDTGGSLTSDKGNYIEIVGKGTSDTSRSNARTLDWNGNETIAGTLTQSSDAKLKDIKDEAIPDVSAIKAVRFTWKEDANRDDSEHIGYLAQDVEKVLPYLVKEDAEGNKVLDYIAFLVAKVDCLERRLAELENT